jgi:hypothetical protein
MSEDKDERRPSSLAAPASTGFPASPLPAFSILVQV